MYGKERTKAREVCQDGGVIYGDSGDGARSSAPDHALLIEEVIDHFDAIAHLDLRLF